MQYGKDVTNLRCARCGNTLTTALIYRDGLYWHEKCWQEGARLLANAEHIARAVIPALFMHTRRMPD